MPKKPVQQGGRWKAGRKPAFVTVNVWHATKGGYVPMEALYGYATTDEVRALLRAVRPLTTPLMPWGAVARASRAVPGAPLDSP